LEEQMFGVILSLHILVCLGLIVVVLLQSGKGGGLAGAFGGAGGVGAVFGGQAAATFLTKATRYLAIAFMLTSLTLAFALRSTLGGGAITEGLQQRGAAPATATGEVVPTETSTPSDLPGTQGAGGSEGTMGEAGVTDQGAAGGEASGGEIPVAPGTE
jgi:preprotein translocase subunit SecG